MEPHLASTSTALVRKRADNELMPPPPPAKKIKRPKTALDEESYTDGLSRIIARDFFPGLLETETQQEYLDALQSKDRKWISSAGRRLQDVMTPRRKKIIGDTPVRPGLTGMEGATPSARGMETPGSVQTRTSSQTKVSETPAANTELSLRDFQAKYTSEDNESFYKLLDRQNQKRVEKHVWAWNGNKLPSKQMIAQRNVEEKLLKTRSLVDDGFKRDRLAITDKDRRPAQPDTWESTGPFNALMFPPLGADDSLETTAQRMEAESRMGPKEIVFENTRMPNPAAQPWRPSSPTTSEVRAAVAGHLPSTYASSGAGEGGETPRVNGYAFVDDEDDEDAALPVISLGPGDAAPNPFQIAEARKRETLHFRMVDRISKSKRTASRNGMTGRVTATPTPRITASSRVSAGSLTPAGQRLWGRIGTPTTSTPMGPGMGVFDTPRVDRGTGSGQGK